MCEFLWDLNTEVLAHFSEEPFVPGLALFDHLLQNVWVDLFRAGLRGDQKRSAHFVLALERRYR